MLYSRRRRRRTNGGMFNFKLTPFSSVFSFVYLKCILY